MFSNMTELVVHFNNSYKVSFVLFILFIFYKAGTFMVLHSERSTHVKSNKSWHMLPVKMSQDTGQTLQSQGQKVTYYLNLSWPVSGFSCLSPQGALGPSFSKRLWLFLSLCQLLSIHLCNLQWCKILIQNKNKC